MSFKVTSLNPKEPMKAFNMIACPKTVNKRQKEKLEKVGYTFGRMAWTMDDFYRNLKLYNVGIDIRNNLDLDLITNVELEEVFGKSGQNGWKPKPHDKLTNYATLLKLYEVVYAHPLDNGQYSIVFLRAWLAQCKGHKVNWIKYAYDYTQLQMKKTMCPTPASTNTTNPQVFKSTNSLLDSTYNGCNVVDDDQASMHMGGVKAFTIVFLPSHIALVKRFDGGPWRGRGIYL
jgi:hypothetical protein